MTNSLRFLACSIALIFCFSVGNSSHAADQRPNVVLVMVDDLGFSDFGCYGSEIATPNIDALAEQGMRFSQFYNTAKCHSSRVSLLTGQYCNQAGNAKLNRAVTIAEVMQKAGYFTAMAGKWHLNSEPTNRGFKRYWGHLSGATNFFTGDNSFRYNGKPWNDFQNYPVLRQRREAKQGPSQFYTTDANVDFAIQFIDEALETKQPFFQYVAFNAPHYPLQAPKEDVMKYKGRYDSGWDALRAARYKKQQKIGLLEATTKLSERPSYIPAWDKLTAEEKKWESSRMSVFAAMVDRVDQNMGRLIQHLKERNVYENTLIMICSDNGACPFERTRGKNLDPWDPESYWCYDVGWAHAGNTPFRWYKQNQHEGGISSPMIAHWPQGLSAQKGSVTHQPGHLVDFMATCLEVGNAKYPQEHDGHEVGTLQGKSLVPIFQGKQRDGHEFLYFQFSNNRAIRKGDWKLVSARGGKWELYNIAKDRSELNDLSQQHPKMVADMSALWFKTAKNVDLQQRKSLKKVDNDLKTFPSSQITRRQAGPK
jgi:arylsulfatase A-like enzyme